MRFSLEQEPGETRADYARRLLVQQSIEAEDGHDSADGGIAFIYLMGVIVAGVALFALYWK
jgi:hypothetical protein